MLCSPVRSCIQSPFSLGGLVGLPSSAVFDVDATQAASYGGSGQTWANLVADTTHDWRLGASSSPSTDDPTFTGSAGSPSAYFALDGGDWFTLASGTNTTFIEALHKTTGGTDWWLAIAGQFVSSASIQGFFGTSNATTVRGVYVATNASNQIQTAVRGDTANVITSAAALPALTNGEDFLYIVSIGSSGVRQWLDSRTKIEASFTKNTSTGAAGGAVSLGARMGGSRMVNGTRIYACSMGNAYIDDAQAAQIISTYNARHGRTYA